MQALLVRYCSVLASSKLERLRLASADFGGTCVRTQVEQWFLVSVLGWPSHADIQDVVALNVVLQPSLNVRQIMLKISELVALEPELRRRHDPGGNWMELGLRLCVEAHIGSRSYGTRSPGGVCIGCSSLASMSFEAHLDKYKQNFKKGHLLVAMTVPPFRTTVELLDASCSLKPPRNGADHMRDFQRDGKRDARMAVSAASLQQFRLPCSTHDLMAVDHAWDLSQVLAGSFRMRPVRKPQVCSDKNSGVSRSLVACQEKGLHCVSPEVEILAVDG